MNYNPHFSIFHGVHTKVATSPCYLQFFLEHLEIMIRADPNVRGVNGAGKEHEMMLNADNISLLISDPP